MADFYCMLNRLCVNYSVLMKLVSMLANMLNGDLSEPGV